MNIAKSRKHISDRVARYVNVTRSLCGEPLKATLDDMFGASSRKFIIGGLVRDLARGGIATRHFDVDIVLDLDPAEVSEIGARENALKNRFGGYGTVKRGWKVDFWAMSSTWAHQSGYARLDYAIDIIDTTFFNVDAIAFDLSNADVLMEESYLDDLRNRILEINLEPNPSIQGNAVRAIRRLKMWNYRCGPRLADFLCRNINQDMFLKIVETEKTLYGKSYASQSIDYQDLLSDLTNHCPTNPDQYEFYV